VRAGGRKRVRGAELVVHRGAMCFSTGEGWSVKGVRVRMRR
jgi:hypothetical protein